MLVTYLALLRGVNVGGNNMIKMSDLKNTLELEDFTGVRTYIQSGNVVFKSPDNDKQILGERIQKCIARHFKAPVRAAVFSKSEWQKIVDDAPKWWGRDTTWKHNILVMLHPYDTEQAAEAIGELKPGIELLSPGLGVLYQSVSISKFGRSTTGKLASNPIYKQMTIRNYNTATKLLTLL